MSGRKDGGAAVHSGGMRTMNNAKAKKMKTTVRNNLKTPHEISWPQVTSQGNQSVLELLCNLLKPIGDHKNLVAKSPLAAEKKAKKEQKAKSRAPNAALARTDQILEISLKASDVEMSKRTQEQTGDVEMTAVNVSGAQDPSTTALATANVNISKSPEVMRHISVGINAVTKDIERSLKNPTEFPPPSAVYLCKGDIMPEHLYKHLLAMVAMLPGTLLFPFLKDAELSLSRAIGIKTVGAILIKSSALDEKIVDAQLLVAASGRFVEPITVSWLPKITIPKPTPSAVPAAPAPPATSTTAPAAYIATNIQSVITVQPIKEKTMKTPNAGSNQNNVQKAGNKAQGKNAQQQKKQSQQQPNQSKMNQQNKRPPSDSSERAGKKTKL
ncbi:hypothetical protein BGW38_006269 [Lunasporangiospora selenospora]|uniref:Uncharacterized protein n=1 Tax=Lunasporangiospora selenospora TaxID=979761 RepID=A0A9P6G445_9FUNG|nr:hypothetical protein BGW38_006269 [Lunasporangiospora selenospora]